MWSVWKVCSSPVSYVLVRSPDLSPTALPRSMLARDKSLESYEACRQLTAEYSKTFYFASLLFPMEKRRAIWAIYAWCRRTDELVDSLDFKADPRMLDRWQERLDKIFGGGGEDVYDLALADAVRNFPLEIRPFLDMIEGMRMDITQDRYESWEELHTYCYRVAGTVGLMSCAVMGLVDDCPEARRRAVALGVAKQMTNILRDVGEDARRNRIYLPLEDLRKFDYSEEDLFAYVVDERWAALMEFEIARAEAIYLEAEKGIPYLIPDARWPVWASLILYRRILTKVRSNGYQNFLQRAYVPRAEKFLLLPVAWAKAQT
ncbi:phytoene synthase [Gloeobacter morelensis]